MRALSVRQTQYGPDDQWSGDSARMIGGFRSDPLAINKNPRIDNLEVSGKAGQELFNIKSFLAAEPDLKGQENRPTDQKGIKGQNINRKS
jgi:hypothetical protein